MLITNIQRKSFEHPVFECEIQGQLARKIEQHR